MASRVRIVLAAPIAPPPKPVRAPVRAALKGPLTVRKPAS